MIRRDVGAKRAAFLVLCLIPPVARPAYGQSVERGASICMLFAATVDYGLSQANAPQVLLDGWQARFQPPSNGMTTRRSNHAFALEARATVEPALCGESWRIGIPVSYTLGGVLKTAEDASRSFFNRKPVAGTIVDWWNPVFVQAIVVKKVIPAIGISVQHRKIVLQAAAQPYILLAQDYAGDDCKGCVNTSHVVAEEEVERAVAYRFDLLFEPDRNSGGLEVGVFLERDGPRVRQLGLRLGFGWHSGL